MCSRQMEVGKYSFIGTTRSPVCVLSLKLRWLLISLAREPHKEMASVAGLLCSERKGGWAVGLGAEEGLRGCSAPCEPRGGPGSSRTGRWRLRINGGRRVAVPSSWLQLLALKMAEQGPRPRELPQLWPAFQEQGLFHYLCCPLEEAEGHTERSH